jgi:CDP-diacylglycerol--serine O-phosphatidyltransferase
MPLFVLAGALVALLVTYPYATLSIGTLLYLGLIPLSMRRYQEHMRQMETEASRVDAPGKVLSAHASPEQTKH